jgi:hypothetical protein
LRSGSPEDFRPIDVADRIPEQSSLARVDCMSPMAHEMLPLGGEPHISQQLPSFEEWRIR